jgi:uncharacterized protein (DUF1697 family)
MGAYVALLRGINVGGHRKVPMAELRKLAEEIGLGDPRTYVASGNLVFTSGQSADALERKVEEAIEERFGFDVDVIVRSAKQWSAYRDGNPMRRDSEASPSKVMLTIGKRAATDADAEALRKKAGPNERVERAGDAIWIWFGDGAGRSKIGTGPTAKEVWTTRNWRTVEALGEMLSA